MRGVFSGSEGPAVREAVARQAEARQKLIHAAHAAAKAQDEKVADTTVGGWGWINRTS